METAHEQKLDDAEDDHRLDSEKEIIQGFGMQLKLIDDPSLEEDDHEFVGIYEEFDDGNHEEEDEGDEEEEFSFMSDGTNQSSAGGNQDGWITSEHETKPMFPLFNRDLFFSGSDDDEDLEYFTLNLPVKKVLVETDEADDQNSSSSSRHVTPVILPAGDEIAGPCCEWSAGKAVQKSTSEVCKKSNSTGFSKIWRLKEFTGRSNSDGKDALVLLRKAHAPPQLPKTGPRRVKEGGRGKTAAAVAHEAYLRSKARVEGKRRTYLPYRPELMGFFTNANVGFTKNVHPY